MSITAKINSFFSESIIDYDAISIYSFKKQNEVLSIQIFIERRDLMPVTIEDCVFVTKKLKNFLAQEPSDYTLEVSSPGINRPLTKPEHFMRFKGQKAKIHVLSDQLKYTGIIANADANHVEVLVEGCDKPIKIEYNQIKKANLLG